MAKKIKINKQAIKDNMVNIMNKTSYPFRIVYKKMKGIKHKHMIASLGVIGTISAGLLSWAFIGAHDHVAKTYKVSDKVDIIIAEAGWIKVINIDATDMYNKYKNEITKLQVELDAEKIKPDGQQKTNTIAKLTNDIKTKTDALKDGTNLFQDINNEVKNAFTEKLKDANFINNVKDAFLKTSTLKNADGNILDYERLFQIEINGAFLGNMAGNNIYYDNNLPVFTDTDTLFAQLKRTYTILSDSFIKEVQTNAQRN